MEEYLVSVNNTVEFTEILEKITDDCALDFGGSKVHKYIHILVNINNTTLMYCIVLYYIRLWQ